jgi:hypothetical protein
LLPLAQLARPHARARRTDAVILQALPVVHRDDAHRYMHGLSARSGMVSILEFDELTAHAVIPLPC